MTQIEVPSWVVEVAQQAYYEHDDTGSCQYAMLKAITAALGAWVGPALNTYEVLQEGMGGCTDGNCVIKRPVGMHTNGGCRCSFDRIKAARMMRAGQILFDTLRQEKPE